MFDKLSRTAALDDLRAARAAELEAGARQLRLAAQWALLHPVARGAAAAGWGETDLYGEGLVPLAGEGTPEVAEFAPAELAAHLGLGLDAGKQLVADALELSFRLPRLWGAVLDLVVPAWRARQVAAQTTHLTPEMVRRVDRMLACDHSHLTPAVVRATIDESVLHHDPERVVGEEQALLATRFVALVHDRCPATTDVHLRLDTPDALRLDERVTDLAAGLRALGDDDPLDVRRAKAVGVLADPQRALDLLERGADTGPRPGGRVQLLLHVDAADLADPATGAVDERLGPVTRDLLASWLGRPDLASVTVCPVLDLARADAVDAHDPPGWMREAAVLRDATCVFPGCTRSSRAADLDHVRPYVAPVGGGPPGQTSLTALAPLCRTHHRMKTHGGWGYERLGDNHYAWTSPEGRLLLVRTRRRRP